MTGHTAGSAAPEPGIVRPSGNPLVRVLLAVIGFYRTAISPLRPPVCRYQPSCSEYAQDAIAAHGAARGTWLALRRLSRCHPFHRGGFDPVPAPRSS